MDASGSGGHLGKTTTPRPTLAALTGALAALVWAAHSVPAAAGPPDAAERAASPSPLPLAAVAPPGLPGWPPLTSLSPTIEAEAEAGVAGGGAAGAASAPDTSADAAGAASAPDTSAEASGADASIATQAEKPQRAGWVFLPGVTYSPDRGLTFAGGALKYFRGERDDARASRLVMTAEASVSGRGMVSFDPDVWFADERFHLGGTVWASYLDYAYFGVGNDTRMNDREDYTAVRGSLRPEVVMRITRALYAGAVYELRYENQIEVEEAGDLGGMSKVPGADSALISGLGAMVRYDTRDHSFTPRSGGLVTLSPRLYRKDFGGDYDFTRLLLEASWFFSLGGEHVIGVDGRLDLRGGEPPFSYLSTGGGSRLLRGMLEGRYRDMQFVGAQAEYRFPLFWRFGGAAFGGAGRVAPHVSGLTPGGLHYAGGAGLRFAIQKDERITVRLDYGRSADDSGFYLAMLEAF